MLGADAAIDAAIDTVGVLLLRIGVDVGMLGLKEWHGDILMLGTVGGTDTDTDNDNDNDTVLCVYRRLLFAVCCMLYVLCCMFSVVCCWIGLDWIEPGVKVLDSLGFACLAF